MASNSTRRRAYVALAGGGAKGVVHVAAVKALLQAGYDVRGWAGTSIGALIAALLAAGYSPSEIIDAEGRKTLFEQIAETHPNIKTPRDLFGRYSWWFICIIRFFVHNQGAFLFFYMIAYFLVNIVVYHILNSIHHHYLSFIFTICLSTLLFPAIAAFLFRGVASSRHLKKALRTLLQQKMFPDQPDRRVKMRDFSGPGPSLKIVAANLTSGRMELFTPDEHPDLDVADAVAASIALPLIFRLPRIRILGDTSRGDLFTDGGIVSNLPAWPFDEERELDPEAETIAVDIIDDAPSRPPGRFTWMMALVRTGFFGSAKLNLRAVRSSLYIPLTTDIRVLDFDIPANAIYKIVSDAEHGIADLLEKYASKPNLERKRVEMLREIIEFALESDKSLAPRGPGRLRLAIARVETGYHRSLRLTNCVGFDDDVDADVLLPIAHSIAGLAYTQPAPFLFERSPFPTPHNLPGPEYAKLRALLHKGMQWILCIPVGEIGDRESRFVICIDGSEPLNHGPVADQFTAELARIAPGILSDAVV